MEALIIMMIVLIITAVITVIALSLGRNQHRTISSDGHVVPENEDLTYRGRTHAHRDNPLNKEFGPQYIVHNEPERGYVILNGVKRKLTECKYL